MSDVKTSAATSSTTHDGCDLRRGETEHKKNMASGGHAEPSRLYCGKNTSSTRGRCQLFLAQYRRRYKSNERLSRTRRLKWKPCQIPSVRYGVFFFFFVGIERTKTRFYSFFADRKPRPFRPRFDHLRPKQYRRFRACKFAHFVTHKSVSRHNIVTKICRLNFKKKYINFD